MNKKIIMKSIGQSSNEMSFEFGDEGFEIITRLFNEFLDNSEASDYIAGSTTYGDYSDECYLNNIKMSKDRIQEIDNEEKRINKIDLTGYKWGELNEVAKGHFLRSAQTETNHFYDEEPLNGEYIMNLMGTNFSIKGVFNNDVLCIEDDSIFIQKKN